MGSISMLFGVLAVVIGLTVAGCGGDDGSDTTTASITKAEFVSKANAACAKIRKQTEAEFRSFLAKLGEEPASAAAQTAAQAELAEKLVIPPKQQEVEEFVALGTPRGDQGEVQAIILAFEDGIKKAEAQPALAARDSSRAFGTSEKLATEYGLEGC